MGALRSLQELLMSMFSFPGVIVTYLTVTGVVMMAEYIKIQLREKKRQEEERKRKERLEDFN
ncbi:MAG: hypothetical protein K6G81_13035 [Lachnospiraceae bacterium]|nr:hypothetical protein [Lachnospiraceae bacterium]